MSWWDDSVFTSDSLKVLRSWSLAWRRASDRGLTLNTRKTKTDPCEVQVLPWSTAGPEQCKHQPAWCRTWNHIRPNRFKEGLIDLIEVWQHPLTEVWLEASQEWRSRRSSPPCSRCPPERHKHRSELSENLLQDFKNYQTLPETHSDFLKTVKTFDCSNSVIQTVMCL